HAIRLAAHRKALNCINAHTNTATVQTVTSSFTTRRTSGNTAERNIIKAAAKRAFISHNSNQHNYICDACNKTYAEFEAFQEHQRSTYHCYCHSCDRFFVTAQDDEAHKRSVHYRRCGECDRMFAADDGLREHQKAKGHCYCEDCDRFFADKEAKAQHLRDTIHVSEFRCVECERDFVNEQALAQHLRDKKNHFRPAPPAPEIKALKDGSYKCDKCDRIFACLEDLEKHLASLIHKPLSKLKCIASSKCKGTFTSPSALIQHLESGGCGSGLTRAELHRLIQQHDSENMITFSEAELQLAETAADDNCSLPGSDCSSTPSSPTSDLGGGVPLAPYDDDYLPDRSYPSDAMQLAPCDYSPSIFNLNAASSQLTTTPTFTTETQAGRRFICPKCPPQSKSFRSVKALNEHLASSKHAPKIFHCPVDLLTIPSGSRKHGTKGVMKEFSTLGALTQHVESEACEGGKKMLKGAVAFVEGRLRELGFEGVRLLG
ncbi:MAG: hypothetical protein LQ338_001987, partial [Usnochroma carphineum]